MKDQDVWVALGAFVLVVGVGMWLRSRSAVVTLPEVNTWGIPQPLWSGYGKAGDYQYG
jgi:hypothetical protein